MGDAWPYLCMENDTYYLYWCTKDDIYYLRMTTSPTSIDVWKTAKYYLHRCREDDYLCLCVEDDHAITTNVLKTTIVTSTDVWKTTSTSFTDAWKTTFLRPFFHKYGRSLVQSLLM
jgi:hypothetical protein